MSSKLNLSIGESCDSLCVSRSTIYRLIQAGDLRPIKIGNRTLIPVAEAERFQKSKLEEVGAAA